MLLILLVVLHLFDFIDLFIWRPLSISLEKGGVSLASPAYCHLSFGMRNNAAVLRVAIGEGGLQQQCLVEHSVRDVQAVVAGGLVDLPLLL